MLVRKFIKLLDSWTIKNNCTHWVEKTPRHLRYIPLTERYVPRALYIHILRNGPEAVASLYDATNRYPDDWDGARSIDKCLERWCSDVQRSLDNLHHERHHFVRYEDLTADPDSVIHGCCEFLGLRFQQSQLESFGSQEKALIQPEEHWKRENSPNIIRGASQEKFMNTFSPEQQKYVQERTQGLQDEIDDRLSSIHKKNL